MNFTIQSKMLNISFEIHEGNEAWPMVLSDSFLKEIDQYPPHQVEALIEKDPIVKRVTVEWYTPWKQLIA